MRDGDASLAWAAIDVLCCLLLVVYTLIAPPPQPADAIETAGAYAIVASWPDGLDDDVDVYVRDPHGRIVYFSNDTAGLMHLERDDLGETGDVDQGVRLTTNRERVILRGVVAGEYVVTAHAYRLASRRVPVDVRLYRLVGEDTELVDKRVRLAGTGDERTAFRFTIRDGRAVDVNQLQRRLVDAVGESGQP